MFLKHDLILSKSTRKPATKHTRKTDKPRYSRPFIRHLLAESILPVEPKTKFSLTLSLSLSHTHTHTHTLFPRTDIHTDIASNSRYSVCLCVQFVKFLEGKTVQILPMASTIRPSISLFAATRFGGSTSMCNSLSRFSSLHFGSSVGPQTQRFALNRQEGSRKSAKTIVSMTQGSTTTTQENALEWVKSDKRRMLHVVYRVGDLDRTIKFYTECLGMKLLRKRDIPEERYTNAFLGYGPEDSHFVIELTYNYGVDKYDIGTAFGHFGIAVDDVAKTVDLIKAKGGTVTREPGPVKGGKSVIAFVEDPDGYKFELIERGPTPEPLCQVMLRVGDLDRSIAFHEKAFGMELLRRRDNPEYKYTIAMMGYGPEDKNAVLELTYNYGVTEYDKGNAYAQIAIGTDDVYKTAEAVKLFGGKITREPGPLPGISTKITACLDPDGWKTVFVDNVDFLKELE